MGSVGNLFILCGLLMVSGLSCVETSSTSSCSSTPEVVDGEGASWACISTEGGTVEIPGDPGSSLIIPPGALSSSTMIVVRVVARPRNGYRALKLEPEGLVLNKTATLEIAYDATDATEPPLRAFHGSTSNPTLDSGSEQTNWERAEVLNIDTSTRTFQLGLDHFSFIYAMWGVQDVAYLVLDIPDDYLRPGDIMVALTNTQPAKYGPNWRPGHVGMFRGNIGNGGAGLVLEATPPLVRSSTASAFRTGFGHIYLGARRPPGGALKEAERPGVNNYLLNQLGLPYSQIGDGTAGTFSCVGLVEKALDSIGRGALDLLNEKFYSTPYEMYSGTRPVDEITLEFGDSISMPVYGVDVVPGGLQIAPFFNSWYRRGAMTVTVADGPEGSSLMGPDATGTYTFQWTPTREQIGGTYTVLFNSTGVSTVGIGLHSFNITEVLTIHVSGYQVGFEVRSAVQGAELGHTYPAREAIAANATIRATHFIDLATGMAPSATPFPEHELTILEEGELSAAPLEYGIRFRVLNVATQPTVFNQPPLLWRYIVDYVEPRFGGI